MSDPSSPASPGPESDATPNGSAWAALFAAGIGGAAFGLLTMASECCPRAAKFLPWYKPAGALSGVAIGSILIWAVAWAALHAWWKGKSIRYQRTLMAVTVLLIIAALLATFPPFYELFEKGG